MFRAVLLQIFTRRSTPTKTVQYDKEALTKLYQEQAEPLYRYFRLRLANASDAEDLTSLVFRKAMESWAGYQTNQSVVGWLFGIARHTLADYYRSRQRSGQLPTSLDEAGDIEASILLPEEIALQQEEARLLRDAINQLPPTQAEVITLRFTAQLSYPEIAAALGKKEPAIRMLLHRGLENLRKQLATQIEVG